ncbi:CORO7 [Acanthosepion pharaonis]|uniref:Coronin n=1 Tax=Acanthosepion pharaonis TaxID=158019 RepID=A0A812DW88_ACAPH|nr:CORO7 [Sepia pharaonis]
MICAEERKIENVLWHPTAEGVLAVSSSNVVKIYDVAHCKEKLIMDSHTDQVQCIAWKTDGSSLATSCKDKTIRVFDPRGRSLTQEMNGHIGQKESRVAWLGNKNMIISTGFDSMRQRQICVWDLKNTSAPLSTQSLDTSPGILIPLFDADTNMLFLIGKGDNTLRFWEHIDRAPYVTEAANDRTEQIKGAAMVPKRALDVMKGEINRMILLTKNCIIPTPYIVPRKSYRDYHADIFPDVSDGTPAMQAPEWFAGHNKPLVTMCLNPAKRVPLKVRPHRLNDTGNEDNSPIPSRKPIDDSPTENKTSDPPLTPKSQRRASSNIMQKIESLNAAVERSRAPTKSFKDERDNRAKKEEVTKEGINDEIIDNKMNENTSHEEEEEQGEGDEEECEEEEKMDKTIKEDEKEAEVKDEEEEGKEKTDEASVAVDKMSEQEEKEQDTAIIEDKKEDFIEDSAIENSIEISDEDKEKVEAAEEEKVEEKEEEKVEEKEEEKVEEKEEEKVEEKEEEKVEEKEEEKVEEKEEEKEEVKEEEKEEVKEEEKEEVKEEEKEEVKEEEKEEVKEEEKEEVKEEEKEECSEIIEETKVEHSLEVQTSVDEAVNGGSEKLSSSADPVREPKAESKIRDQVVTNDTPAKKTLGSPSRFSSIKQHKFKHLKGTPMKKNTHIENLRNLSKNIPGESDMFHANRTCCAVPLSGAGGCIGILELNQPGRLPDTGVPTLQHGANITDFAWDPFNDRRLVVSCDDAKIRVWNIPEGGLTESLTEPESCLVGHREKIYFVHFHPLAKDILASASYDMTVKIWNLATGEEVIELTGHTSQIFTLAWSPDGKQCATVCKDGKIRIYDPRTSTEPVQEGNGPPGSRGARVVWVLDGKFLAVTGFDKMSNRQISIYNPQDLSSPIETADVDVSPAILIPHYDEDSSTLFMTGRGDGTLFAYEMSSTPSHINALSHCRFDSLHQAISFLPKIVCNISEVEFARAWRLTPTHVEPVSFTVPRVKSNFFQDDLFPDTKVLWEPTLSGSEWLEGNDTVPPTISLKPDDMEALSNAPSEAPKPKKYDSTDPEIYKTDEDKKEELIDAMTAKMDNKKDELLPQDLTEGVDSDEWEE